MTHRDATLLHTLLAGAILVLAALCYFTINQVRGLLEDSIMGAQEISTTTGSDTITTERGNTETVAEWLERHKQALEAADDD